MKRSIVLAALAMAALAMAACGGSGSNNSTPGGGGGNSLDGAFTGTWNGTTTLTFQGNQPSSYAARLVIAVSGQTASLADLCPDGSGAVTVNGSGRSAQWSGTFNCPPVSFNNCSAVAFTYHTGSISLDSNSTLTVQGTGSATGCGTTLPMTTTFVGNK